MPLLNHFHSSQRDGPSDSGARARAKKGKKAKRRASDDDDEEGNAENDDANYAMQVGVGSNN